MSVSLFIGVLGVFIAILFNGPIKDMFGKDNRLVLKLKNAKWFQNHWIAGIFVFSMNAILFVLTGSLLYLLMFFSIPFVHLLVMVFAVMGSIFSWILINKAWKGTKRNRLKVGAIGSSFYIFLTFIFAYWFVTLKPSYPGEDTFMGAIGLVFAIIVTTVAFITCFVITGFSKKSVAQ